jgi:hypothetical protein
VGALGGTYLIPHTPFLTPAAPYCSPLETAMSCMHPLKASCDECFLEACSPYISILLLNRGLVP